MRDVLTVPLALMAGAAAERRRRAAMARAAAVGAAGRMTGAKRLGARRDAGGDVVAQWPPWD